MPRETKGEARAETIILVSAYPKAGTVVIGTEDDEFIYAVDRQISYGERQPYIKSEVFVGWSEVSARESLLRWFRTETGFPQRIAEAIIVQAEQACMQASLDAIAEG